MSDCLVIANPISGRGVGERTIPRVIQLLKEQRVKFDLVRTERPWHAAELARRAVRSGYRLVVALGGDGTSNEVLNGLMEAREAGEGEAAMGVLCVGTGNDFAYGVGIPKDLEEGCAAIARRRTRWIDVGLARGFRYFGNGIGIGFDAAVNVFASRLQRFRGFLVYLIAVLRTLLFYYHSPMTRVELDDRTIELPALMISVMNGRRMGGGFLMAPHARPDDGLFDLCIGGKMSRPEMISFVPRFIKGTQVGDPRVIMARSHRVRVSIQGSGMAAHADGETLSLKVQEMDIEVIPQALQVVY
ncbi:MAG: diacylglycerol kinase family lipid kinase [Anaerolineae bacterium]|nr:diacylglycerol kinase family lipid kinase [Anaerolineae bacterium]MDW7992851.1 diacylglycerol kinase family lipid kinase [Anaerolineae bacterium]